MKEIEQNGVGKVIKEALMNVFSDKNDIHLKEFEKSLEQAVVDLSSVKRSIFRNYFEQTKTKFYDELKSINQVALDAIINEKVKDIFAYETAGRKLNEKMIANLVEQAQQKFDTQSTENFEELSAKYLKEVRDQINSNTSNKFLI